jgi:hypothetical protein
VFRKGVGKFYKLFEALRMEGLESLEGSAFKPGDLLYESTLSFEGRKVLSVEISSS